MTHIPPIRGRLVGAEVEYRAGGGGADPLTAGPLLAILSLEDLRLSIAQEVPPALVFALRTAAGAWWAARGSTLRVWSGGPPRTMVLGRAGRATP